MKRLIILSLILALSSEVYSQTGVAINNTNNDPAASSMLDISSTTKGILLPRMTEVQKNAIVSPDTSLIIYQTNGADPGFYFYTGTGWEPMEGTAKAIDDLLDGSDGLGLSNMFLGSMAGETNISGGNYNVGLGVSALQSLTSGDNNSAVGYFALNQNSTGSNNTASGYYSMYFASTANDYNVAVGQNAMRGTAAYTSSDYNTAIGSAALYSINGADYNTAIGRRSLYLTSTGNGNTASGYYSMYSNTTGIYNTASGYQAMYNATTGNDYNIAIGQYAMNGTAAYTNSDYNIAVGGNALYSIDGGDYNIATGYYSMYDNTTGAYNTASGYHAMRYATTANDYNVAMGRYAMRGPVAGYTNSDYNIAIGDYALYSIDGTLSGGDNNIALGNHSLYTNSEGIGNLAFGYYSLFDNTTGDYNTASGSYSLTDNTTGTYNTASGYSAMRYATTANDYNIAIGRNAMRGPVAGYTASDYNIALGDYALYSINGGDYNFAVGRNSLYSNTTGNYNTATGYYSMYYATTSNDYNIAIGRNAMRGPVAGYSASDFNTALGDYSMYSINGGDNNAGVGRNSLYATTSGIGNIGMGSYSGDNITTGSYNIMLGYDIDAPTATASNQLNIGNLIYGTGLDGRDAILSSGNIGIGTKTPDAKLDIYYSGAMIQMENSTSAHKWEFYTGGSVGNDGLGIYDRTNGAYRLAINDAGYIGLGTTSPTHNMHLVHDQFTTTGGLILENSFNNASWQFYVSQSSRNLALYVSGASRGSFDDASGVYSPVSDKRLKENIESLDGPQMLEKLISLEPKRYDFIDRTEKYKHYGFIAQEVQTLFPEFVTYNEESDLYVLSTTELIPVTIKAVQEQQKTIESQKAEINDLKAQMKEMQQTLKALSNK
jgi:trimeric autotransporter adhesin